MTGKDSNNEYDVQLRTIKQNLAVEKNKRNKLKKELTKIENITGITAQQKEQMIADKQKEIDNQELVVIELEDSKAVMKAEASDEDEARIEGALTTVHSNLFEQMKSLAYVIKDGEFVFITDRSTSRYSQNVVLSHYNATQFVEWLATSLKLNISDLPPFRVKQLFIDNNRSFEEIRYTVSNSMWSDKEIYLPFSYFKDHFINQFKFEDGDINPDTDPQIIKFYEQLMYSVSGGKKENQDHLEQWIVQKVINYNKPITTPELVIVADVGGNGKGILMGIMARMFPRQLVGKANTKTLNGNFNAIMLGKLLVFFDDQNNDEYNLDSIKELSGAETMIYEPKGKDQYEAEKTHSSAFFAQKLPFRLSPDVKDDGVNRRFSVMRTNVTFFESIIKHNPEVTEANVKTFANMLINDIMFNRVNIAKWFQHLQKKHPMIDDEFELNPLHGEDYKSFLEDQKGDIENIWDRLIIPVLNAGGCVPIFVIKECITHLGGNSPKYPWTDKRINKKLKELALYNKLNVTISKERFDIVSGGVNALGLPTNSDTVQKTVVALTGSKAKLEFDWNLVSDQDYKAGLKQVDGKLIDDANFKL